MNISSVRLRLLSGFLLAAPLFAADPAAKPADPYPPTDDEVRTLLTGEEIASWKHADRERFIAGQELARAKDLATPAKSGLKGYETETETARKNRADALTKIADNRIADADRTVARLHAIALDRMNAGATTVTIPVRPLPEALRTSSSELLAAAKTAGFDKLAIAGVFIVARGKLSGDAALTEAFRDAIAAEGSGMTFDPAPTFDGDKLAGSGTGKTGVILAEVHPLAGLNGAIWIARLVGGAGFTVTATSPDFIPNDKAIAANPYGAKAPTEYEAVLRDRRDFFAHLGVAKDWSFGIAGTGPGTGLLRLALAARNSPPLNDYAFLAAALRGEKPDAISKAFWSVESSANTSRFLISSHPADKPAEAAVPVGEIFIRPVPENPAK